MSDEIANWAAMVLLSAQERVRHIAVWSDVNQPPGPICRNRGYARLLARLRRRRPVVTGAKSRRDILGATVHPVTGEAHPYTDPYGQGGLGWCGTCGEPMWMDDLAFHWWHVTPRPGEGRMSSAGSWFATLGYGCERAAS